MRARLERQTHHLVFGLAFCRWVIFAYFASCSAVSPIPGIALGIAFDLVGLALLVTPATRPFARFSNGVLAMVWPLAWLTLGNPAAALAYYSFVALAFLATYRDWRVIALATAIVCARQLHDVSQIHWDALGWLTVESVLLILGCLRSAREMDDAAGREATLEHSASIVQQKVENRTRALQAKSERYRALVENTEAIPFEYDIIEQRVVYMAPRATKVFGVPMEELRSPRFFDERTHPDDQQRVQEALARFVQGDKAAGDALDYRICTPERVVHIRSFFSGVEGTRLRGLSIDVTRQAVLEHELRQAQKLESVGRLAAGVAHEINTPVQFVGDSMDFARAAVGDLLAVVAAQHRALASGDAAEAAAARDSYDRADVGFVAEELPRALERALDGVRRIAVIVRSMKVFARAQTSEMASCDLRQAIESTITIARGEYKDVADVSFSHDDLPLVRCHGGEINQVVLNLLVNASQAIAATGRHGRIAVELRQRGDDAVITVRDTGGGIPAHVRDHVFDQFFTTKPVGAGTGQGLAIARAIIEKHQGSLTFETGPEGTCFFVRLPLREDPLRSAA